MYTPVNNPENPDSIELRGVNQSYDGGKAWIIKDLNFLLEHQPDQGKFAVVLGVSGCGKSTILRYIAGLQKPTSGEVLLNGKLRQESDCVSMVFQQYSSLPFKTVLENVMLPLRFRKVPYREARDRAMEMIKIVGLGGQEEKYAKYPLLSGGQLQRVAIARSLISNPNIILMDEPFGALDTHTRFKMQTLIADIFEKVRPTILFVTHDISEAVFLADEIYIMRGSPGQIETMIPVPLPVHRDRATKRDPVFIGLVQQVEDALLAVTEAKNSP